MRTKFFIALPLTILTVLYAPLGMNVFGVQLPTFGLDMNLIMLSLLFGSIGMAMFMYHALSPWLSIVDQKKYEATVNASRSLGPTTLALAHSPVIREAQIDAAYDLITEMPSIAAPPCPDQSVLDAFLGLTSAEAPA